MQSAILLGLLFPLLGFVLLMAFSYRINRKASGWIGCLSVFFSFICFSIATYLYSSPFSFALFPWIPISGIHADASLLVDSVSLFMTLVVTSVGFLIFVYSNGYMEKDTDFARFFACMNFFIFSMLLLVLAEHLLVLFVGWEGVGLASYLLIGFWHTRPQAAKAATKAFVVNRIGDFAFLLGLLFIFMIFRTGNYEQIFQRAKILSFLPYGENVLSLIALLLFIGAIGKSAQLPLHVWLPDAMEGPTPVSALIHAATMVTAGVYLVVRMSPLFLLAPKILFLVGVVGCATALFAALSALSQTDLKRVLAYSTISQIGYMFLACGAHAFYSALFHLMSHAFVKALLFLSAGNVIHMMHGVTEMKEMGGLRRVFTKSHWLFLIGVLALSGIPPLTAFFSKDLILEHEFLAGYQILFYIGLATSFLTAVYLMRAYYLTFLGPMKDNNLKEAPLMMIIPTALLALLTIGGGFLGMALDHPSILESFLSKHEPNLVETITAKTLFLQPNTWISIVLAFIGFFGTWIVYATVPFKKPFALFYHAFYVNEIYAYCIVLPCKKLAKFIADYIEPYLFEGSIDVAVTSVQGTAKGFQLIQSGQIRSYVAWIVFGVVFLIAYLVF